MPITVCFMKGLPLPEMNIKKKALLTAEENAGSFRHASGAVPPILFVLFCNSFAVRMTDITDRAVDFIFVRRQLNDYY